MELSPEAALYVGQLEGTLSALVIDKLKMQAYLELITGEQWQPVALPFDTESLRRLAVATLTERLGMTEEQATELVSQRISIQSATATAEDVVPQLNSPDMKARLQGWKDAKAQ